jgi:hypothetical protein
MINKSIENDMLGIAFSEEEFNDKDRREYRDNQSICR